MKRVFLSIILSGIFCSAQIQDYKKAPNSYLYDTDIAATNNYDGLYIPVKKAYDMWEGYQYLKTNGAFSPIPSGTQSASLYWEDYPGLISNVELIPGSTPSGSKIKVTVNTTGKKGNAVVAFKVNNTIYWSWHIWVTDNPENGVTYSQGFETDLGNNPIKVQYMDRNLGAVSANFLGDNWEKSGGLLYQWGRKDPFPPLIYKDSNYYEITGDVGKLKHKTIDQVNTIPVTIRPSNEIEKNIQFSVKNPINYILNTDAAGNWFSSSRYRTAATATSDYVSWDLWSDNAKGTNGNASSSNIAIRTETRSYELKSELDPCPQGWRVPSYYGRVTMNNNLAPFGRKNSGGNDDLNYSYIYSDRDNVALSGVKVYPGIGIDFTNAQSGNRNIGKFPVTGSYVYYPNSVAPNAPVGVVYQDNFAVGTYWSATYSYDGARVFSIISDPYSAYTKDGLNRMLINQTNHTKSGNAVRCMRDPNVARIGNFSTEYFSLRKIDYTKGLNDPNSYIVKNETTLSIPVNKAFSVYNQLLSDNELPQADHLVSKVLWTTSPGLVKGVKMEYAPDIKDSKIIVTLNPNYKGNAVISLHNGTTTSPVLWSWHIWAPDSDPAANASKYLTENPLPAQFSIVNSTSSYAPPLVTNFMDRNLGAESKYPEIFDESKIEKSHGLQFQWGRKDPFPKLKSKSGASKSLYLGSENSSDNAIITYTTATEADLINLSKNYSVYGASATGRINQKIANNIKYSIQHPMAFMYQSGQGNIFDGGNMYNNDLTKVKDWVSDERAQATDRWGHGTTKSVFDPCPEGWRVPDVSTVILYNGSKGNSPWYNGYKKDIYGKNGVIQNQWHSVADYYGGSYEKDFGWKLNNAVYPIGSFAEEGIRGEFGENNLTFDRTGIWTASMADHLSGYGLAMLFEAGKMQTGTGVYPQAAMGVRCAKDELRYTGEAINFQNGEITNTLATTEYQKKKEADVHPNPFKNEIFISNSSDANFEIFDMSGRIVLSGKTMKGQIETEKLQRGMYIIKINEKGKEPVTKKIIKI